MKSDNNDYSLSLHTHTHTHVFPSGSDGKESACSTEDPSSVSGSRRSSRESQTYLSD